MKTNKNIGSSNLKKNYWKAVMVYAVLAVCVTPALAADPLSVINNLSNTVFSIIKAVGIMVCGWGIVQFGMSIQSHDASQRTQGILCLVGGLMITFAKELLVAIGAI